MSEPTIQDINDILESAYPPKLRERMLHEDWVLRMGFWVMIAQGEEAALKFVKEEMEQYDKEHKNEQ